MLTVQVFLEDLGKCWQTQTSSDSATYAKPYPIGDSPRIVTFLQTHHGHCVPGGANYPCILTVNGWLEDLGKCWQTQTSSDSATYRSITATWQQKACNISTDPPRPLRPRGASYPHMLTVQGWLADLVKRQPQNMVDSTTKSQLLDDKSRLVRFLKGCRAGPVQGGTICTNMMTARVMTVQVRHLTKSLTGLKNHELHYS